METVASRIRYARENIGASQAFIAKAVGVSRESVSKWESGASTDIRGHNIIRLASVLNTTPEWLLGGDAVQHQPYAKVVCKNSVPITHNIGSDCMLHHNDDGSVIVLASGCSTAYGILVEDDITISGKLIASTGCGLIVDPSIHIESGDLAVVNDGESRFIAIIKTLRGGVTATTVNGDTFTSHTATASYVVATVGSGGIVFNSNT